MKPKKTHRRVSEKEPRHVRLYHWMMDTPAWHDLSANARAVYPELAKRYGGPGSNNGSIPMSLRELAAEFRLGKSTIQRALDELEDHGFIVCAKDASFTMKHRHSREWLLTEFKDDRAGHGPDNHAAKTFANWHHQKSKHGLATSTERSSQRDSTVPEAGRSQTVTMADGPHSETVGTIDGPATGTPLVYHGNGASAGPSFQERMIPR